MDPGKYNRIASILAVALVITGGFFVFQENALAATGINEQINFQGKLVNTDGTNITDGTYNMEFKIYQDGDGVPGGGDETLKWTEDRLRNNSQGVVVADGIFQVNLGSVAAFSGIDWNQSVLWVSINVGDTNATCTPFSNCVPDGEMDPMIRFTAAPYALNAGNLEGKTWEAPGQIGLTTQNTGNFTTLNADSISTDTGGVSIAAGQSYTGAGAVTLSSTTNGLTLDSGNNILTIDSSDTTLTAAGVTTLTLAANTSITNASGNISFQAAGTGTANVQIGDGGATSATPDLLVLDVGSAEPSGTVGAMYYSTALTKFRCYQGAAWADCIGTGGAGLFTDGTDITYLTDTVNEDFAIGSSTLVAPFSVDEENNTVRIGDGAGTNGILNMYASNAATGTIEYTTNDSWYFNGGNVGIGTASPTSKLTVQSTTDSASLGTEMSPNVEFTGNADGWTLGLGGGNPDWYYNTDKVSHANGGGTADLKPTTPLTVTAGASYLVSFDLTGYSAGSVTASIGGTNGQAVSYNVTTFSQVIVATNTNNLKLTPTDTFVGNIDNVSVKLITTAPASFTLANAGGTNSPVEFRSGGDNLNNTFIGLDSGKHNTGGGERNNTVGSLTLYSNTTGDYNNAMGYRVLFSNTTGSSNNAIGDVALYSNTTGNYNTAIGDDALYYNTTGSSNSAMGMWSLFFNTTGSSNSAMGNYALYSNTTGYYNTAMGMYALLYLTGAYHDNTALGYNAGRYQADGSTALTSASQSIYIGSGARGYNNSDVNSIVIGYQAAGIGANSVVLGNDSITTTALKGSVGIGTAGPDRKLDILDNANPQLRLTYSDNTIYSDLQTGANGGVAITGSNLTVNGAIGFSNSFTIANATGSASQYGEKLVLTSTGATAATIYGKHISFVDATSTANTVYGLYIDASTANASDTQYAAAFMNGNVGIGVTGPTAFLDIKAATTSAASLRVEASSAVDPSAPNIGDMWFNGTNLYFRKDGSTSQDLLAGGAGPFTDGTDITYLTDTVNEDFAIGSSTLVAPFSVDEENNTVRIGDGAGTNGILNMYASNAATGSLEYTTNDSWDFEGGNVGIANSSPSAKLDIDYNETTTTAGNYYGFRSDSDSTGIFTTGTTNYYGIYGDAAATGVSTGGTVNTYGGYFTAAGESTGAATTKAYGLYVNGATGADNNYSAAFMNGNVGIETDNPLATLQVGDGVNSYDSSQIIGAAIDSNATLYLLEAVSDLGINLGGILKYDGSSNLMQIGVIDSGTETFSINIPRTTGKVGIGTTGPSAKLDVDYNEITTTAGNYYGFRSDSDSTGIFTTGTTNYYGIYGDAAATGVSTGGTVNTYGGYFTAAGESTGAATTKAYGLYVNGATGADNNYSAAFMNGNVGIGTATPAYRLSVINSATGQTTNNSVLDVSTTTGATFNTTAGALTSRGGYFSSTATRSAGANDLTNIGVYANASAGAKTYGVYSYVSSVAGDSSANSEIAGTYNSVSNMKTTDLTNAYGTYNFLYNDATATTLSNFYGTYVDLYNSSGTISNAYGLYVDDISDDATNAWAVYTNGATKSYFGGNVGIGTTGPGTALEIAGPGTNPYFRINSTDKGVVDFTGDALFKYSGDFYFSRSTGNDYFRLRNDGSSYPVEFIVPIKIGTSFSAFNTTLNTDGSATFAGNVGIGTTSPTAFLDITAATTSAASLRIEASAAVNPSAPNIGDMWFNGTNLYFRKDGSTSQDLLAGGAGLFTDGTDITYLTDTVNEDFAIGSSTLVAPFSVDEENNTVRIGDGAGTNGILNMYASNAATGTIEYTTNDSWYFNGGNIGIGTASPGALLHVLGITEQLRLGYDADSYAKFTTAIDSKLTLETAEGTQSMITVGKGIAQNAGISFDGNTNDYYVGMDDTTDKLMIGVGQAIGTTPYLTVEPGGDIGIGVTDPTAQLHTTGTVRFAYFGAGTLVTDASGNVSVSSDERLKTVSGEYETGLEAILKINPIIYKWNDASGMEMEHEYVGFSAQNVQSSIPEAVGIDARGFLTLSDRSILAALVNGVKEQQAEMFDMQEINAGIQNGSLAVQKRIVKVEDLVKKLESRGLTLETRISEVNSLVSDQQTAIAKIESQLESLAQEQSTEEPAAVEISGQNDSLAMSDILKAGDLQAVTVDLEKMENEGALVIGTPVEFRGPAVFMAIAEFIDKVIFRNDVQFAGRVMFNQDTAGYALIREGQDKVAVAFKKEYAVAPVVNASLSLQQIKDDEVREAAEELLLISDVKFIITNVTERGFEIRIDSKAMSDIPFSWTAIAVKDTQTFSQDNNVSQTQSDQAPADNNPSPVSSPTETAPAAPAQTGGNTPAAAPVSTNENSPATAPPAQASTSEQPAVTLNTTAGSQ